MALTRTSLSRFTIASLLLGVSFAAASIGCRAQSPPAGAALTRRIAVMVRSQMNLAPQYAISVGTRGKSEFAGYDELPVTFSLGQASRTIPFLISTDDRTLIRMDKIDLTQDPALQVSTAGRPFRGGADAKVTIIDFDDLECPFCARTHRELFPQTLARYGDKVKIVYKDYPLPAELHPWAMHAAVDSNCLAGESSDAYWNFVDFVHDHHDDMAGDTKNLPLPEIVSRAEAALDRLAMEEGKKVHADEKKLQACISAQDTKPIAASLHEGESVGVDGTPLMLVNGEKINGYVDLDVMWRVIDQALKDAGVAGPPPVPPPAAAPAGQ